MLARLAVLLVLALLAAPAADAFATDARAVELAYALAATPAVIATGALQLDGELGTGLLLAGADGTEIGPIPELTVTRRDGTRETFQRATLVIESGALVWPVESGQTLGVALRAPYAFAIALPQAPLPSEDGATMPGFLLAGEALGGEASWRGGVSNLLVSDGVVTLEDADGRAIPGWDSVGVNAGQGDAATDENAFETLFEASGAFDARVAAGMVAGAVGDGKLGLVVHVSEEDRFDETLALVRDAGGDLFGGEGGGGPFDEGGPLSMFSSVSGMLNGALFVLPGMGEGEPAQPLRALVGGEALELGPFSLLRGGELALAWEEGEMRVAGEPDVVLGREGFAVDEPRTLGLFPVVSVFLWALALAALVWYFVRRPPEAKSKWPLRLASAAANLVILVVVFMVWDASFAATFGTSAITVARAAGVSPDTLPQIGTVLALELVPWGIAAVLFALPVRIVAGVALRYLGKGKSFKGLANAAGLVALAVLGPLYAMWCFNLVLGRAFEMLG